MDFGTRGARSVSVAVARPGRGFGTARVLERHKGNMAAVDVAVQPTGRVVAVWRRTSNLVRYALAPRNRTFGTARDLTKTGSTGAGGLAVDPRDGAVVLAYGTPLGVAPPVNGQAAARTLTTTSSAFSAPVVLSDPSGLAESYPAVVAGSGGVGVAFIRSAGARTLHLVRRAADGTWPAPQLIARPPFVEDVFAIDLKATLPADGGALAAWTISTEPGGRGSISKQTVASVAASQAPFGAPAALTPANETYGATAVASAGDDAYVATATAHGPVLLATRSTGGATLSAPRRLTADGDGDVLLAAGGSHVLAAWQRDDRLRIVTVR